MTDAKVGGAAFFSAFLPATNLFLGDAEPLFRVLALVCQIVVAVVTTIYICKKIKR